MHAQAGMSEAVEAAMKAQMQQQMLVEEEKVKRTPYWQGGDMKGDGICPFWRKTGKCLKGASCRFIHGTGCRFWLLEGRCVKGDHCDFPHLAADKCAMRVKRTLCKHYMNGKCLSGRFCGYAHGEAELGTPDISPLPDERGKNSGKKMHLCKFWASGSGCNSGSRWFCTWRGRAWDA